MASRPLTTVRQAASLTGISAFISRGEINRV